MTLGNGEYRFRDFLGGIGMNERPCRIAHLFDAMRIFGNNIYGGS